MKKNILSIVILALVIVNLVLTGIMMFSIVPASKKTNALVTQICSVLDLELEANAAETGESTVPIDQIETYDIPDQMTVNLKKSEDGEAHVAVFSVTISMDKKNKDFEKYGDLSTKVSLIKGEIINLVSAHTLDEVQSEREALQQEILASLQKMYDSDFIISVTFSGFAVQ